MVHSLHNKVRALRAAPQLVPVPMHGDPITPLAGCIIGGRILQDQIKLQVDLSEGQLLMANC